MRRRWRPVAWAAGEAMVADGFADAADLARWEHALIDLDRGPIRPTSIMATFLAVGRRRARPDARTAPAQAGVTRRQSLPGACGGASAT
jgi:hypothetical protein